MKVFFGILSFAFGLLFLVAPWGAYYRDTKIEREGKQAPGRIVRAVATE